MKDMKKRELINPKASGRGQVAMEFLMTYGWAILLVLLMLGAFWFLGVFSGKVPTVCNVEGPFTCTDIVVSDGTPF